MNLGAKITVKNNGPHQLPKLLIFKAKLLQFLSPSLAANFALKIFSTPIKHQRPEREEMMAKSAKQEELLIPQLNKKVILYSYGYSKRKVLIIPGWSGRGTQLFQMADKLLENGFMVVSMDGPAHGNSTGKNTNLMEFIETTLHLQNVIGPFEAAIGHSFGALTILNSIARGLNLQKAVTIGSSNLISYFLEDLAEKLQLGPKVPEKMRLKINKKLGVDVDQLAGSEAAKKIEIPVFVVHDTQDKEVPVSCAMEIRQNLKKGQLLISNGLGHKRILNDPKIIKNILTFIKN